MVPLTRYRTNKDHVHGELAKTYYSQHSSVPGILIITEVTFIAPQAAGYTNTPGIWSDAQIAGWKAASRASRVLLQWMCVCADIHKVTEAVHAKGSFILLQLWALSHTADPVVLNQEGGFDFIAFSPIPFSPPTGHQGPVISWGNSRFRRSKSTPNLDAKSVSNVMEADFDGVELHAANGHLLGQFLHTVSNQRVNEYGGSFEGRSPSRSRSSTRS